MADNADDYHIYVEPEGGSSGLLADSKKNESDSLSNSRKGRRASLSVPKDLNEVKDSFKNAKENTLTNLHQGADTFVGDMQDMVWIKSAIITIIHFDNLTIIIIKWSAILY